MRRQVQETAAGDRRRRPRAWLGSTAIEAIAAPKAASGRVGSSSAARCNLSNAPCQFPRDRDACAASIKVAKWSGRLSRLDCAQRSASAGLRPAQSDGGHELMNARVLGPTREQRLGDVGGLCIRAVGERSQSFRKDQRVIIFPVHYTSLSVVPVIMDENSYACTTFRTCLDRRNVQGDGRSEGGAGFGPLLSDESASRSVWMFFDLGASSLRTWKRRA